jgi:hypothetical protein
MLRHLLPLVLIVAMFGCVERRLTITTEPKGSLVYLNDKEVGRTPITVPFEWYGDYDVVIRQDGYETLKTHKKLKTPWYEYIPIDFFAEILWPATVYDDHFWNFDLEQSQPTDIEALKQRALSLRTQAKGECEIECPPATQPAEANN